MPSALRPRRAGAALLAAALGVGLAGCGTGEPATADGRLRVVATTGVVADFARQIGGAHVEVTQILQPNVDPHDYEPSPADLVAMSEADVVVQNGVGLEHWLEDTLTAADFDGTLVDASKGVTIRAGDDEHAEGDPHIWHNPQNAQTMVANIEQAYAKADPQDAAGYAASAAAYSKQIDALDAE